MHTRTITRTAVAILVGIVVQFAESAEQTFRLPVLTVKTRISGKTTGSCSYLPLSVSVTDSKDPLRISFSDDTPNGSGETIRNSLWTAALIAGLQKESPLQGVRISLDFKGGMDGPSAGAVMCLGIMTALDGRDFPADFAMTGTILPDGTVGLVGGIAEKLKAVAKNPKIKRVAIPAFLRFEKDADGNWTDLHELGRSLGLELRPVESIGDAYRFLHKETRQVAPVPSALLVSRESPEFEAKASEIFQKRDAALWARLAGLSSNEVSAIVSSWEWRDFINPTLAEQRFEEGAIFDALSMIARADASLSAYQESWEFYSNYYDQFISEDDQNRGIFSASLSDKLLQEWPIDRQLAFIDGFRAQIEDICELVLGWRGNLDDKEETKHDDDEEPWHGFIPEAGSSDLSAQLLTMVETARAEGQYRYMLLQTSDRSQLEEAIRTGEHSIIDEIDYDRRKLFFLLREQFRQGSFQDVPLPVLNVGPESNAALELFRKAWTITDATIESDVVKPLAASASAHVDSIRLQLMGIDSGFAVYDAARKWGTVIFMLHDESVDDGVEFAYPGWTSASLMFYCAELFAEASAQLLKLDNGTDNASFMAFVMDRARMSALQSLEACRKAGIPCFRAVMSFQKAERDRASNSGSTADILSEYWKSTMFAKALVMAFRNGVGPEQGFTGYPETQDGLAAREAMEAILGAALNADLKMLIASLPEQWIKAISDSAAVVARKMDDATWVNFLSAMRKAGILLCRNSVLLTEWAYEENPPLIQKKDFQFAIENWGMRLLGLARSMTREAISEGRLAEALSAPMLRPQGGTNVFHKIPLPAMKTQEQADGSIIVSIPDWGTDFSQAKTSILDLFGVNGDAFRRHDGKMVMSDMITLFETCGEWKDTMDEIFADYDLEARNETIAFLRDLTAKLDAAAKSTDKQTIEALFNEFDATFQ